MQASSHISKFSRNLRFQSSQSSPVVFPCINILVYSRRMTNKVTTGTQTAWQRILYLAMLGGLTKFGVTPDGGGRAPSIA